MGELDFRTVRELMALRARLRELMEKAMLPHSQSASPTTPSFECPIDVWETDTEFVVEAELPGATTTAIELRLEGDKLVIAGELPAPADDGGTFLRVERYRGPFRRVVTLPADVGGSPQASLRSGVLQVRLPRQVARRRRIAVDPEAQ
jgi:HSP20 family molecular chaperone IbpA